MDKRNKKCACLVSSTQPMPLKAESNFRVKMNFDEKSIQYMVSSTWARTPVHYARSAALCMSWCRFLPFVKVVWISHPVYSMHGQLLRGLLRSVHTCVWAIPSLCCSRGNLLAADCGSYAKPVLSPPTPLEHKKTTWRLLAHTLTKETRDVQCLKSCRASSLLCFTLYCSIDKMWYTALAHSARRQEWHCFPPVFVQVASS